jgi:hypothetical protein
VNASPRAAAPCKLGDAVGDFVERLGPLYARCGSLTKAWEALLPPMMREHCRIESVTGGSVRVTVDAASYMYELQLCKAELLAELQRLCPGASVRRIVVAMARGTR